MTTTSPDWLTQRGGELRASKDGKSCTVHFAGEPQYLLLAVPAAGKYACRVSQTINGKRLDGPGAWPTLDEAIRGGLDHLRQELGW